MWIVAVVSPPEIVVQRSFGNFDGEELPAENN